MGRRTKIERENFEGDSPFERDKARNTKQDESRPSDALQTYKVFDWLCADRCWSRPSNSMFFHLAILFCFTLSLVSLGWAKKTKPPKINTGTKKCYDVNMQQIPCPVDKKKLIIILSVVFGIIVLAIIVGLAVVFWKKRRQQKRGDVGSGSYKQLENNADHSYRLSFQGNTAKIGPRVSEGAIQVLQ